MADPNMPFLTQNLDTLAPSLVPFKSTETFLF